MLALVTAMAARDLDTDLPPLVAECDRVGVPVEVAAWDDPSVDWSRFAAVVLRSTWDYPQRRDEFLAWIRVVDDVTRVWNPREVVEWNLDKRYLRELAASGVPTVPTAFVEPGGTLPPDELAGDRIVKPTVGAGSNGVVRTRGDRELARRHVERLHASGQVAMVQPYLGEVDRAGETALVYVGGAFSHAFSKRAIFAAEPDYSSGVYAEEDVARREPSAAELEIGHRVVASLPELAYARVDLLPTPDGPVVLELELVEPSLYVHCASGAAERAVAAFRRLMG